MHGPTRLPNEKDEIGYFKRTDACYIMYAEDSKILYQNSA